MEDEGNTAWGSTYGYGLIFPIGNQKIYIDNIFLNIGAGTGHLWNKLTRSSNYPYSKGDRDAPKLYQWLEAIKLYYGTGKDLSEWYPTDILSIITKGTKTYYGEKETKELFEVNSYYNNR